ncbi:HlyD family type I secretion periplasmic adaptor subunit [Methylobacterium komagatae]|uniref:Membrane fusion protein (MFP) family protein n=1 Tax=Methylobacterium komagatae TaxID=374425 RepID=A0ABW2BMN6_9HYPH
MKISSQDKELTNFQSEVEELRNSSDLKIIRLTSWIAAGVLVTSLAFAAVARVDRVITSERGKIVPSQGAILFQALDNSLIKTLDVKEGDRVAKGQLLATLDPTFAEADVDQLARQLASVDAQISRANAEQTRNDYNPSNEERDKNEYVRLQKNLYDQRKLQFNAQMASFDQKIAQTQATIQKLQGDEVRYKEREKISQQIEGMRQTLVERQAGSLLNLLLASDTRLEMLRTMENGQNSLIEARHQIASIKADRDAFVQQWMSTSSQDLVSAQGNRDGLIAQLAKASRHKDLVRLTAPEDAFVLSRAKVSVGAVLQSGTTLLSIVPENTPIEVELNISARDIGFVRAGDAVSVKVDAFPFIEHGQAFGKLSWISEGAFTVDDEGRAVNPFYRARATISESRFVRVPKSFRLVPGMTLTADIHIGDRSILGYIIAGATRSVNESMREP